MGLMLIAVWQHFPMDGDAVQRVRGPIASSPSPNWTPPLPLFSMLSESASTRPPLTTTQTLPSRSPPAPPLHRHGAPPSIHPVPSSPIRPRREAACPPPPPSPYPPPLSPLPLLPPNRAIESMNRLFESGKPSDTLSSGGVLLHLFDGSGDPERPWLPCPNSRFCAMMSDRISATVVNRRRPFLCAGMESQTPEPNLKRMQLKHTTPTGILLLRNCLTCATFARRPYRSTRLQWLCSVGSSCQHVVLLLFRWRVKSYYVHGPLAAEQRQGCIEGCCRPMHTRLRS